MKVLIDGDILLYEVGFGVITGWKGEGIPPFDYASELMDSKIAYISNAAVAGVLSRDYDSALDSITLYISGEENFRKEIAKKKGYKEQRKEAKRPFHYYNLKAYLQNAYTCVLTDGVEADDQLCIDRAKDIENSIVCSRDKDLKQHEGWIYSWDVGNVPSFGPVFVKGYGEIELVKKKANTIKGVGQKFFLSQVLTGDSVDNYPGLPGCGPVEAFKILGGTSTYGEGLKAVVEAYRGFYGDSWKEELEEQASLAFLLVKENCFWRLDEKFYGPLQE